MQQSTKTEKRIKDRKDRAIRDTVLDNKTLAILKSVERNHFLRDLSGVLAAGKESNVYTCYTAPNLFSKLIFTKRKSKKSKIAANESSLFVKTIDNLLLHSFTPIDLTSAEKDLFSSMDDLNPQQKSELLILLRYKNIDLVNQLENSRLMIPSAVKIYQTSKMEFKKRLKYLITEERFKTFCHKNPRKLVKVWAEKEVRNMKRLLKKKIPTAIPLYLKRNVFVMSCLQRYQCYCMLANVNVNYEFSPKIQKTLNCDCLNSSLLNLNVSVSRESGTNVVNRAYYAENENKEDPKRPERSYNSSNKCKDSDVSPDGSYPRTRSLNRAHSCTEASLSTKLYQEDFVEDTSHLIDPEPTKISKTASHILFNAAPKLKDFRSPESGVFVDLYFQAIKIMKDMYQKCSLIHSDLSEYNLLVTTNRLDTQAFCSNSQHHASLEKLLDTTYRLSLSKKEIRHLFKSGKTAGCGNFHDEYVFDHKSHKSDENFHKSDCFMTNIMTKLNLPRHSLYVIDLGQAVDINHIFADEFLIKDIKQVNQFFENRGVDVFFINDIFVEVTGKFIPGAFRSFPLTEKVFIPNCLEDVIGEEDKKAYCQFDRNSYSYFSGNLECCPQEQKMPETLNKKTSALIKTAKNDHIPSNQDQTYGIERLHIENINLFQGDTTSTSIPRVAHCIEAPYNSVSNQNHGLHGSFDHINVQCPGSDSPEKAGNSDAILDKHAEIIPRSASEWELDMKAHQIPFNTNTVGPKKHELIFSKSYIHDNSPSREIEETSAQAADLIFCSHEKDLQVSDVNNSDERVNSTTLESDERTGAQFIGASLKDVSFPVNSFDSSTTSDKHYFNAANVQISSESVLETNIPGDEVVCDHNIESPDQKSYKQDNNQVHDIKALRKQTKELRRERRKSKMPKKVKKKAEAAHKKRK